MGFLTRFTRRDLLFVIVIGGAYFTSSLCVSLQAPFYPREAEKKGATASEYGLVFGVFQLVAFLSCPLFGKYIDKIGPNVLLIGGIVTAAVNCMLFGMLTMINSHGWFIGLSFLLRVLESLGSAAIINAGLSITVSVFNDSLATMFAALETFIGLGLICGPIVGGFFYEIGGFMFPFVVVGGGLLLDGMLAFCIMPKTDEGKRIDENPVQIMSVLRIPAIILNVFATIAISISTGFVEVLLEPHLRQFHLTTLTTSSMFIINATTYMLTAPLVGILCDKNINPKIFTILGSLLIMVGIGLMGPAPFLPFDSTLWVICVSLVIHGLGMSCIMIASFVDSIQSASDSGLPEDIATYGIVTGLMTSSLYLGGFIGPSVGGVLYTTVGFQKGSLFVIGVHGVLFVSMTWFVCSTSQSERYHGIDALRCGDKGNFTSNNEETLALISNSDLKKPAVRYAVK